MNRTTEKAIRFRIIDLCDTKFVECFPHYRTDDNIIAYYLQKGKNMIPVTNDMAKEWGVNVHDLFCIASDNMLKMQRSRLAFELFLGYLGYVVEGKKMGFPLSILLDSPMVMDDFAKRYKRKIKGSFYVIRINANQIFIRTVGEERIIENEIVSSAKEKGYKIYHYSHYMKTLKAIG